MVSSYILRKNVTVPKQKHWSCINICQKQTSYYKLTIFYFEES